MEKCQKRAMNIRKAFSSLGLKCIEDEAKKCLTMFDKTLISFTCHIDC